MESWDFVQNIIKDIFKTAFFSLLKREARFYLLEDLKKTKVYKEYDHWYSLQLELTTLNILYIHCHNSSVSLPSVFPALPFFFSLPSFVLLPFFGQILLAHTTTE